MLFGFTRNLDRGSFAGSRVYLLRMLLCAHANILYVVACTCEGKPCVGMHGCKALQYVYMYHANTCTYTCIHVHM